MTSQHRFLKQTALAALLALLLVLPLGLSERPFELRVLTLIFLFALLGQGWNVLGGYAGQISIGHGLFFGLGAYTSTILALKFGVNPWVGMFAGGAVAATGGVLIGVPCFRLKGHYFVIATLVVAESAYLLFTAWDWVGGAMGLSLPVHEEGLRELQFNRNKLPYYYVALVLLVAVTAILWWLQRSSLGYIFRALRDDEEAVRSLGFSPARYKFIAMAISAAIVGVGGVFFAQYVLFIDPGSVLALSFSVMIALIPILGGVGTLSGPILGAATLVPISEYSRMLLSGTGRNVDLLVYGLLIMVVSVYEPNGLIGLFRRRQTH